MSPLFGIGNQLLTPANRLLGPPDAATQQRLRRHFGGVTITAQPRTKIAPRLKDKNGRNLLDALLTYDPQKRIVARDACDHPYFGQGTAASYLPRQ